MSSWNFLSSASFQNFSPVEFLKTHIDLRQTRPRNKTVNRYLADNCAKLLEYALSETDEDLANKAFVLLSKASRKVVQALVEADLFFIKATEVLTGLRVSTLRISRLATMLGTIIEKQTGAYAETIGFLCQLLPFISDASVFSLMCSVCAPSSKESELQRLLAETSFAQMVLKEFEGCSNSAEKQANLCAVICVCLRNPILQAGFRNEEVIGKLEPLIANGDLFLQNHIWEALADLCSASTCPKMENLQRAAIEMLQQPVTTLHIYHVCVFDFLGKFVQFAPSLFTEMQGFTVLNTILRWMAQFPDSTNLVGSMFRFLRAGLRSPHMRLDIISVFVPILVAATEGTERTAVTANAIMLLADIEASRGGNAVVDQMLNASADFREFRRERLMKYMTTLKAAYGGPITKYVKKTKSFEEMMKLKAKSLDSMSAID
jgi:hypothetical protein